MKLEKYLKEMNLTGYQFALLMQINPATIYTWLTDKNTPTFKNAKKIEKITGGKVPPEEFGYKRKK